MVLIDRYAFGGCGNQAFIVRIDKPSGFRVIVSALEVVQSRLRIIDIPAVAERIELTQRVRHGAGGGQRIAPCVIGVRHHLRAAAVDQPGHIALRVLQVEVLRAIVGDGHGPQLVVGEVQGGAKHRLGNITESMFCTWREYP